MAGPVQWTVDQFWAQLQALQSQIDHVDAALKADKATLTRLYDTARRNMDPARDAFLAPLIHRNSVLRLQYLAPVRTKFAQAVNSARAVLRKSGYTTPQLSGLGVIPLVPVVAATAVIVALAAVAIVWRLTESQISRTQAMARVFADPHTTPEQKLALSRQMAAQIEQENKSTPPPLGFNLDNLLPIAALIAAVVLVPPILKMGRRATA